MSQANAEPKDPTTRTPSGIEAPEVATPDMVNPERIGEPGKFPFTRGIFDNGYRGRLWTMRQFAGFGTAEETNERFKLLLERGQTGLSTAFDLPTQLGLDSDDPMSLGEVGREGVSVAHLGDMRRLIRQYGRTAATVFPTGAMRYRPGNNYGNDVNLVIPFIERNNPKFNGCLDRNP